MTEQAAEFVQLKDFDDYEILSVYPFTIRRKDNHHEVSESYVNGYLRVPLNRKSYKKHILIGKQFIPNDDPEHKTQIDHINHQRDDNHLSNLRWVSQAENLSNKSSFKKAQYEFVDDIPDDALMIDFYETRTERHEFEEHKYYYYHDESNEDIFYSKLTDNLYKILHINIAKSGAKNICARTTNNKYITISINRFKFQHNLIE